jgi:hypothetical protein
MNELMGVNVLLSLRLLQFQRGRMRRASRARAIDDPPRVSVNGEKGLLKFLLKATTPYCDVGRRWRSAGDSR